MNQHVKKFISMIACCALVGCTNTPSKNNVTFTPGTYQGVASGMKGEITVDVTVSESKIESVVITNQNETYGLACEVEGSPVDTIPLRIVETQSLAVDNVTGATVTSNAIKTAVANALEQAGADVNALKNVKVDKNVVDQTMDASVVIAGAGAAGLSAGIEALENGATNVVILEKQGITGGATARSGGKLIAAGSSQQVDAGFVDTSKDMESYMKSMDGAEQIIDDLLKAFCDNSLTNLKWLESLGVMIYDLEPIHTSIKPYRVLNTTNEHDHHGGGMTDGFGGNITVPLTKRYLELGGKIVYNTTVDEILTNDGEIVGVTGTTKDGAKVTVNASKVILATGGYASNREMMARYASSVSTSYATTVPAGNVGDGLTLAAKLNAKVVDAPAAQTVYLDFNSGVGINEEASLILDGNGKRVANEYTYMYHVGNALFKSNTDHGWYICTTGDPSMMVQYAMTLDATIKADTIEGLAKQMEVDPDVLRTSIERYNALAAKGVDEDFGKPAKYMYPIEGEQIFALKLRPSVTVTFGGLEINTNAEVLDVDGNPIPNLYAAGEVAFTGLFGDEYPGCGMAIGSAVYYGRVAGANAVK